MNVGLNQFNKETPKVIKRVRDAFIYTAAGSLPFAGILSPKLGLSIEDYGGWVGFLILGIKGLSMCFGVNDEPDTNTQTKQQ